ncbi:UNVERIFIED_CONTAM: hypothetical protein K2H54_062403 [Gekko kuhli]
MSKVRGKSWTQAEVLDLLALWGDAKIQTALSRGNKNIEIFEDVAVGTQETSVGDEREAEEPLEPLENQDRDPEQLPPDVYMADLTAGERAAFTKARKKRVSALQSVGELLAAQAQEEHRKAWREDRRDFQEFLMEMRAARQEDQDAHAMMLAAMERSLNSTDKLTQVVLVPKHSTHWNHKTTHAAPRHPATGGAGPLKSLGHPSPSNTPGRQFTVNSNRAPFHRDLVTIGYKLQRHSHAAPAHRATTCRHPLHRVWCPSSLHSGDQLQCYTHAAPSHPAATDGACLPKPLGPPIPPAKGGPRFCSQIVPSHQATSYRPQLHKPR